MIVSLFGAFNLMAAFGCSVSYGFRGAERSFLVSCGVSEGSVFVVGCCVVVCVLLVFVVWCFW